MCQFLLCEVKDGFAVLLLTFGTKFVFIITPSRGGVSKQAKQEGKEQGVNRDASKMPVSHNGRGS